MRALLLLVLMLSGCGRNDELRLRLADEERQLALKMAIADQLNEHRKALDNAQQDLAKALAQAPEDKAAVEALEELPFTPSARSTFPPLPHESLFGGSERARLRRQLQDVEARIAQLAKVIEEDERLDARRRHVKRQLEFLRERAAVRKP